MATSTDSSAERTIELRPSAAALDRAQGVDLLGDVHGSGYESGAALVRRADGQMVQLGPLMYALLECVDGRRSTTELAGCLSEKLDKGFDDEHVVRLAEKLAAQGLLAGHEQNAPPRRNPLLALRWKVLITNPRTTRLLTAPFTPLFRPFVLWPVIAAFVAVLWFVLFHKGIASATSEAFNKPGLLLLIFALGVASAAFHEIGHAAACRYGGATPGGMGAGIYLVWPAFYTDVTDAYRLPRTDRLRVDFGGLYFNALVSVLTMGAWLLWHVDALFLLIALQLLMMVKNLSPVIRSDGYHILADATGVPDLYAHIGPTIRRLIPWRPTEPSALKGRARALVTLWVLIVVPVLLSLLLGAVLLLPRMLATAWGSGGFIAAGLPHELAHGHVLAFGASLLRLVALVLPLIGSLLVAQRLLRGIGTKAHAWSAGRPARRVVVVGVTALACCGAAWAWFPAGQYQEVHAADNGTLGGFASLVSSPVSAARPVAVVQRVQLTPGTHLAVSMIPVGGATKAHPALFVIAGKNGRPATALLVSPRSRSASTASAAGGSTAGATSTDTATTTPTTTTTTAQDSTSSDGGDTQSGDATAFPFKLPSKPGPGDSQALAVNTKDGSVKYDIAYSLVTVADGKPVTNTNSAYALASCKACMTTAVSFQVVLIVGRSNLITPINAAVAANANCPACITTAIADQIVITLTKTPPRKLTNELMASLKKLNAISELGQNGTPAAVAAQVMAIQKEIDDELSSSGLVANTTTAKTTTAATTTAATTTTATTTATTTTATQPATTTSGSTPPPPPSTTAQQETTPTTTAQTTTAQTTTTETTTGTTTTTATTTETTTTEPTTTAQTTTTTSAG